MVKKDKETRDKKQEVRVKEGFTQKMKQKRKTDRRQFSQSAQKIIFRRYGDEGNKLRRRKSREITSRTKEVKKKTR